MNLGARQSGLTVLEILISVAIGAILVASLSGTVGQALGLRDATRAQNDVVEEARFAMDRMLSAVGETRRLMRPLADNPGTAWREHVREQTVPPSPPETGSTLATAVLAVTLPASQDLDADGWADANNDRDFLDANANLVRDAGEPERLDEDPSNDQTNDGVPGVIGIDDDGDGAVDETTIADVWKDNDEDDVGQEDWVNGIDDDGDGAIDEDWHGDANFDNAPGIAGVDDDLDGDVDEGQKMDDDEDGTQDDDWLDPLVYFLETDGDLIERRPLPYDANADSAVNGLDYVESVIAENVTRLRFERVPAPPGGSVTVDVTLELAGENGNTITLHSIARLGAKL